MVYMQESKGSSKALQVIWVTKEGIRKSLKFYYLALELGVSRAKTKMWVKQIPKAIVDKIIGWVEEQLDT